MSKKSFAKKIEYCYNRYAVTNFLQISGKPLCKSSREVSSAIQVEVSTTIIITVTLTLPLKQFWDHLFSTYPLLKCEQETDIKTRLLNLHDAFTIENSPSDFEFHLHGTKVIGCDELKNDILDNFNHENKDGR